MKKIKIFAGILVMMLLMGCTDKSGATRTLSQNGYKNIEIRGYDFFGCSKGDTFATQFRAKNSNGYWVKGVVCSGILKGTTIRTY